MNRSEEILYGLAIMICWINLGISLHERDWKESAAWFIAAGLGVLAARNAQ